MYKLTLNGTIIRLLDNASIPNDPRNSDYMMYLKWIDDNNTPEQADIIPEKTYQEKRATKYRELTDPLVIEALRKLYANQPEFAEINVLVEQIKADNPIE